MPDQKITTDAIDAAYAACLGNCFNVLLDRMTPKPIVDDDLQEIGQHPVSVPADLEAGCRLCCEECQRAREIMRRAAGVET